MISLSYHMDINQHIESLKEQFNHSNVLFAENINNIFNELLLVKNLYLEQDNNVKRLLEKVEQERAELKEKNGELDAYRKVSFIKSMDKQIEEKDRVIELMTKRYKNLEKKCKKLEEAVNSIESEPIAVAVNSIESEPVAVAVNSIESEPVAVAVNSTESEPVAVAVNSTESEPVAVAVNSIDEVVFEPFYEILEDDKEYFFTKDEHGVGCFYRKLKNGKISKKRKGTWTENEDGELELIY